MKDKMQMHMIRLVGLFEFAFIFAITLWFCIFNGRLEYSLFKDAYESFVFMFATSTLVIMLIGTVME